jgi:hypothetical protein
MGDLLTRPQIICSAGMTVDGREVTEETLLEIVETYNPKKYGARINLDHEGEWSGWAAKNLYNVDLNGNGGMLGDVEQVWTAKNEDGVLCLHAILSPNASFVALNKADQAVYYSAEIDFKFQGSDKAYLTGLAATDYPACCYTTRANFSKNERIKDAPENYKCTLDFSDIELAINAPTESPKNKPFSFKNIFNIGEQEDEDMKQEDLAKAFKQSLGEPLEKFTNALAANTAAVQKLSSNETTDDEQPPVKDENQDLTAQVKSLGEDLSSLKSKIEELAKTPADDTTVIDGEHDGDGATAKYKGLL